MKRRQGVSLVEFLLFVGLGFVVLGALFHILHRGMTIQDATAKSIDIMVQARNTMENLNRDVHSAIAFLPPVEYPFDDHAADMKELVIIRDPLHGLPESGMYERLRPEINDPESTYPFYNPEGNFTPTQQQMHVTRVRYIFDKRKGTIDRIEQLGLLKMENLDEVRHLAWKYTFIPSTYRSPLKKRLAKDARRFDFVHVGFDRAGKPRVVNEFQPSDFYLESWPDNEAAFLKAQTVLLFVALTVCFDKGLYGKDLQNKPGYGRIEGHKDRKAEIVEMVTKIVSYKKVADMREKEWFSSADDDLRY